MMKLLRNFHNSMLQHVSVVHHNMVVSSNQNDLQVTVNLLNQESVGMKNIKIH